MAEIPKIINVGKSYLVYEGEEYQVENERVKKHTPKAGSLARKNKDLNQIVAVYSEILHNDLSVSHHQQMMDEAEVKQILAEAKIKNREITENDLKLASKGEAIIKTEFHDLDSSTPPANPFFRTRSLGLYKLLILFSPLALYGHAFLFWMEIGRETNNWPISADNQLPVLIAVLFVYVIIMIYAVYWLISVTREIKSIKEITYNFPGPWGYIFTLIPIAGPVLGILFIGRFVQNLNRLIGKTGLGFFMGLMFVFLHPLSPISIFYFQRRLNILDKNKMNFIIE